VKACPVCGRLYPPDAGFCPIDGQQLYSATQVPVAGDQNDPRIGQMLGERYQVRRVVADGGMGRVYEALDLVDRRNLALKVLHADVVKDEVSLERFKREFEVSKLLPHKHIVEVLDFKPTHDGSYVLVMEFLYGEELRNTLKREKVLPPERIVRMLSQVALALDDAHARKLVHRDLKPDNLFLCQTSEGDMVKLLDFGSVKDKSDPSKKLTVLGTTIGSPFYMAPEQAQGLDTLDHRADVWALAAITYECAAGQVPFKGNNGPSILLEILTKEPQPVSVAGQGQKFPIPPTLDRVLAHGFRKAPGMRISSVGALADAVGQAYGLGGTHHEWAVMSQQELAARIAANLPALMQAQAPPAKPADAVADGFFGESDALGLNAPPGAGVPASATPGLAPGPPAYSPQPAQGQAWPAQGQNWPDTGDVPGVPKSSLGWLVAVLVGGFALVIGIVVVLVVMR
jgi:eukaryotic-like serine/threonine-protein kinase